MAHPEKTDLLPPDSVSFTTRLNRVLTKLWPLLVALAILAYVFARIPQEALWEALKTGPCLWLAPYVVLVVMLTLLTDAYATVIALSATGLRPPRFSQIFWVRGATYLPALLNYSLGQGAFGFYLKRSGLATTRAAGIVIFLLIVNSSIFLVMTCLGVLAGALLGGNFSGFAPLALGLAGGMLAYLGLVCLRPRFLQSWQLAAPLLEAGIGGHLQAAAGRIPLVLVLILTYWGAMHLWGITVPLVQGFILIPVILFFGALPITPIGLGTTQAAMVLLVSSYVPLPNPEAQAATVLAFSLVYHFLGIIAQAGLGFWCYQKIGRLDSLNSCRKADHRE